MAAAKSVYLIIFLMLVLPIVYFGIKKAVQTASARSRTIVLFAVALSAAALACLCLFMYKTTIATQPLLVIERGVRTAYQAAHQNKDPADVLQKERLTQSFVRPEGLEDVNWSEFSNASIDMPRKSSQLQEGRGYVVSIASDEENIGIALTLEENETGFSIRSMRVLSPSEYNKLAEELTFFNVGTLA